MADLNSMAYRIVRESTEPDARKVPAPRESRQHGAKGGQTRAAKLSPERRSEIARKAAQARWARTAPK